MQFVHLENRCVRTLNPHRHATLAAAIQVRIYTGKEMLQPDVNIAMSLKRVIC
jgi:hypothetical protein